MTGHQEGSTAARAGTREHGEDDPAITGWTWPTAAPAWTPTSSVTADHERGTAVHHHQHHLSRTTHTVEMDQLAALNEGLRTTEQGPSLTAADLGLAGTPLLGTDPPRQTLEAGAVLDHLCYEGDPEYPYVHAHFRQRTSAKAAEVVDLHTQAIQKLSRLLHLRGLWGTGSTEKQHI